MKPTQYKDKNGETIYVGDIVEIPGDWYSGYGRQVWIEECSFGLTLQDGSGDNRDMITVIEKGVNTKENVIINRLIRSRQK